MYFKRRRLAAAAGAPTVRVLSFAAAPSPPSTILCCARNDIPLLGIGIIDVGDFQQLDFRSLGFSVKPVFVLSGVIAEINNT
jgi:hypothetical protein